ncbi:MAG: N-methyl-L-tryptophan oxidase [Thermomicrobiales bacterium]|nr:N-methyl-L-tryptophan oxidase [Thermomicrobiales bacterium]
MAETPDVIVIGLGVMGSSTAYALAKRGLRVLGIDALAPGHDRGSSHGESRIIRQAYHEAPDYVPLIQRSYALWRELEAESNRKLLWQNGGLIIGAPDGRTVAGTIKSGQLYNLPYELLSPAEVGKRHPGVRLPEDLVAVLEPQAGFVLAAETVRTFQELARANGAALHFDEPVLSWSTNGDGVTVTTGKGSYQANRLVIAAGPWSSSVLADLGLPLEVQRVPNAHFLSERYDHFDSEKSTVFSLLVPEGHYYAIPGPEKIGFKIGRHDSLPSVSADDVQPAVTDDEITMFRRVMDHYLPGSSGPVAAALTCLYTMTPDKHFILDRHPEHEQVVIACGFSGHGFKFAPVVGEVLSDLTIDGQTDHPIGFLRASRFSKTQ